MTDTRQDTRSISSVILLCHGDRELACARPDTYAELEDLSRKEFGCPDDAKLVFTTDDLPASKGRRVELHHSSWAVIKGLVGIVAVDVKDNKFRITITCNLQKDTALPGTQQFQTRGSQTISSILAGACAAFGINKTGTRLVLLRLDREPDGTPVERRFLCALASTVSDSGIQAGSRLVIEHDPETIEEPQTYDKYRHMSDGQLLDKRASGLSSPPDALRSGGNTYALADRRHPSGQHWQQPS